MDILSVAAIQVPCSWCGEPYSVPLRDILLSHEVLHEGCAVETECPPVFQAALASPAEVEALEQAWRRVERRAMADGGELVLLPAPPAPGSKKQKGMKAASGKRRPGRRAA